MDWLKLADTVLFAVSVILHVLEPEQPPLHPEKEKFAAGDAVSVTCVPCWNVAEQVVGQLMPAGVLVTVPVFAVPILTIN